MIIDNAIQHQLIPSRKSSLKFGMSCQRHLLLWNKKCWAVTTNVKRVFEIWFLNFKWWFWCCIGSHYIVEWSRFIMNIYQWFNNLQSRKYLFQCRDNIIRYSLRYHRISQKNFSVWCSLVVRVLNFIATLQKNWMFFKSTIHFRSRTLTAWPFL